MLPGGTFAALFLSICVSAQYNFDRVLNGVTQEETYQARD